MYLTFGKSVSSALFTKMAKTIQFAMKAKAMGNYAEHSEASRSAHFRGAADLARQHRTAARKTVASQQQVPVMSPKTPMKNANYN